MFAQAPATGRDSCCSLCCIFLLENRGGAHLGGHLQLEGEKGKQEAARGKTGAEKGASYTQVLKVLIAARAT